MGLDMFLNTRRFLWIFNDETGQDAEIGKAISAVIPEAGNMRPTTVEFEAIYWRKANAIHKWFVDNVQDGQDDCRSYYVSRDKLRNLLEVCETVLKDNSRAEELLPSQSGFFFGGTDYDERYFKDLQHTRDKIDELLSKPDFDKFDFQYQSSW
jgi:hypothetical protein